MVQNPVQERTNWEGGNNARQNNASLIGGDVSFVGLPVDSASYVEGNISCEPYEHLCKRCESLEKKIDTLEGRLRTKVEYEHFITELHEVKDLLLIDIRNDQLLNSSMTREVKGGAEEETNPEDSDNTANIKPNLANAESNERLVSMLSSKAGKKNVYEALKKKLNIVEFEEAIAELNELISKRADEEMVGNMVEKMLNDRNLPSRVEIETRIDQMIERTERANVETKQDLLSHLNDKVSSEEFTKLQVSLGRNTFNPSSADLTAASSSNIQFIISSMEHIREDLNSLWTQVLQMSKQLKTESKQRELLLQHVNGDTSGIGADTQSIAKDNLLLPASDSTRHGPLRTGGDDGGYNMSETVSQKENEWVNRTIETGAKVEALNRRVHDINKNISKIQKNLERQSRINHTMHQNYIVLTEKLPFLNQQKHQKTTHAI
eukprot:Nk52_evm2s295 gene=Nk52_evmTU2s295